MEEYDKVRNWLISSGLCVLDKDNPNLGGVHSFYDAEKNEFGFLYPEITGYNISTMKFLYSQDNSPKYLEIAKLSGNWLMNLIDKYGGIIMGIDSDPRKRELVFSFDSGICAKGLLDLYEMTRDNKYKEYAKNLLHWISSKCLNQDGTLKPVLELKSQKFIENSVWYMKNGCFHIKVAMPFLQFPETDDSQFKEAGRKICNTFTNFQNEDGSFSLHKGSKIVNLHTHCYALEGLLYSFFILKNSNYLTSCKKGLEWAINKMNEDGSVPLWVNYNHNSKACYPIAQLIRLLILVDRIDENTKYKTIVTQLTEFLLSLQVSKTDPQLNGGFYEEFYKTLFSWKKRNKLNSWGSMFALQALNWEQNYDNLSFENSINQLF